MSTYRNIVQPETRQALRRQKMALTARLRENWRLKVISLVAAVCLNVFIQNERNPTTTREYVAEVTCKGLPRDTQVVPDNHSVNVTISGPKSVLDQVKAGDVVATANLDGRPTSKPLVLTNLIISDPKLPHDQLAQLNIDPPQAFRCRIVRIVHQWRTVEWDPKPAPPGYHYGNQTIQPFQVQLSGWQEHVDQVKKIVVQDPIPDSLDTVSSRIDGDFQIHARDSQGRDIDNVDLEPSIVHVTVPILQNPLARLATISADIWPLPSPPYTFEDVQVEPKQVKIAGPKEQMDRMFTLSTMPISLAHETKTCDFVVDLAIPDGLKVFDGQGRPIQKVKVHVEIHKSVSPTTHNSTIPTIPPVDPNG